MAKLVSKAILLLNIYELKSLIIADIETFNKIFNTKINNNSDVHFIKEPKEFLIQKTEKNKRVYKESECPDLFMRLNIDTIAKNSKVFNEFLKALSTAMKIPILKN